MQDKADKDKRATIAIPSGISTPLDNILMPTVVTPTSADNSTATSGAFLMPTTFVESASSAHLKPAPVSVEITPDYDCSADLAKLGLSALFICYMYRLTVLLQARNYQ